MSVANPFFGRRNDVHDNAYAAITIAETMFVANLSLASKTIAETMSVANPSLASKTMAETMSVATPSLVKIENDRRRKSKRRKEEKEKKRKRKPFNNENRPRRQSTISCFSRIYFRKRRKEKREGKG